MAVYNDIDKNRWKEYEDIKTDTLWLIDKRDNSGAHNGNYHGNFVPPIPHQLFSRYTKRGDWILDPFMGSGTSLIEAQRMERNSIGIELQKDIAYEAKERISTECNSACSANVLIGDSKSVDFYKMLDCFQVKSVQFIIMHPPYWDIIKFSEDKNDLSNAATLDEFLNSLGTIIEKTTQILDKNRYCALVIGDKYANSRVIPLGFHCMNLFLEKGLLLKAILVKNFGDTKGKSNKQAIWRYRAITSDFYIFKHEYIFIFKKVKQ